MPTNNYLTSLPWNDFFLKLKTLGEMIVDKQENPSLDKARHISPFFARSGTKQFLSEIENSSVIPIEYTIAFRTKPNCLSNIHKDGSRSCIRYAGLNIPLFEPQGVMEWFSPDLSPEIDRIEQKYNSNCRITEDEVAGVDRLKTYSPSYTSEVMDSPAIVNTNDWHRINNLGLTKPRWVLSVRFKNNPSYQDLTKVFLT